MGAPEPRRAEFAGAGGPEPVPEEYGPIDPQPVSIQLTEVAALQPQVSKVGIAEVADRVNDAARQVQDCPGMKMAEI